MCIAFFAQDQALVDRAPCAHPAAARGTARRFGHPGRLQEGSTLAEEVRKHSGYRRRWVPIPLGQLVAALVERELILDAALRYVSDPEQVRQPRASRPAEAEQHGQLGV
jgi:hypothetical protein